MVDLAISQARYNFNGTLDKALYMVGDNVQFELIAQPMFMINEGLMPTHNFLDLACGCLRGTAPLVDYMDEGHFYGADISAGLIQAGYEHIKKLGIGKTPNLFVIENYLLGRVLPVKFDYVLSVSLFTHLLPYMIQPLFQGVASILKPNGTYYFTLYPTEKSDFEGNIEIAYHRKKKLIEEGLSAGLKVEDIPGDYKNPSPVSNYIDRVNVWPLAQWVMKATLL